MYGPEEHSQAISVTVTGMVLDLVLSALKIGGGVLTQSFALITDGIHSLSDAATDLFVLLVARISHQPPDTNHPYGHGRFETLGTIVLGVVFCCTATLLLYSSYQRLLNPSALSTPAAAGMLIAAISIAGKEWIFRYTLRVANRLNSNLLRANAWHSRSDALSSIAVLAGLFGAQQGYLWMDATAAMFVALIIAKIGWELCSDSLKELVDTAVPAARQEQIEQCILEVDGIHSVTWQRSRSSGGKVLLEAEVKVSPAITVSEGLYLSTGVQRRLLATFSDLGNVMIHVSVGPESSTQQCGLGGLPSSASIATDVQTVLATLRITEPVERLLLHYSESGVDIEIAFGKTSLSPALSARLSQELESLPRISKARIVVEA